MVTIKEWEKGTKKYMKIKQHYTAVAVTEAVTHTHTQTFYVSNFNLLQ